MTLLQGFNITLCICIIVAIIGIWNYEEKIEQLKKIIIAQNKVLRTVINTLQHTEAKQRVFYPDSYDHETFYGEILDPDNNYLEEVQSLINELQNSSKK